MTKFGYTKLNPVGIMKAEKITKLFEDLHLELTEIVGLGGGRELAIVTTKLEEACMFAKKAVSLDLWNTEGR